MRSQLADILKGAAVVIAAAAISAGCGSKEDPGKGIAIAVKPSNDVLLGPGPSANCLDYANRASTGYLERSVRGPVATFNAFSLVWENQEILYVAGIRVKVEGSGLPDGVKEFELSSDEITMLLESNQATLTGPTTIISNAATRKIACGLPIGPVTLTDGNKTASFRGRITIELIGSAEDAEGKLRFVRARTSATFMYYGS